MFSSTTVAALAAANAGATSAGTETDGATSRAVSPPGPANRRRSAAEAFVHIKWNTNHVRFERRPRKCMRELQPTEAFPDDDCAEFHAVMRIADATPKGRAAITVGDVKDHKVVHHASVRAALSLPDCSVRRSMKDAVRRLDRARAAALMDATIDQEVSKMVNAVSEKLQDFGCRTVDAGLSASLAYGTSYRKALEASKESTLDALDRAVDKAWEIPSVAVAASQGGGSGAEQGDDDDEEVEVDEADEDDGEDDDDDSE